MSYRSERFIALQCDYPGCVEIFDDGEFSYYMDGPDTSVAEDHGWLVLTDRETTAYCPGHVRVVPCPPETLRGDAGETWCAWCDDRATDTHLAPFTTSVADQLEIAMRDVLRRAHGDLDMLALRVDRALGVDHHGRDLGGAGTLRSRTNLALNDIHRRACRAIRPDLTDRQIYVLQQEAAA